MGELRPDRFGFVSHDLSPTSNSRRDNARLEKWQAVLSRWDFELRSRRQRLKQRIRKGIPDCLRGKVWWDLACAEVLQAEHDGGIYEKLAGAQDFSICEEEIRRDTHRIFPNHILFREGDGRRLLCRVLRTYSLFAPQIGYCQGMGSLVGILLMYMDEQRCFWMLVTLMEKYELKGLYVAGLPRTYRSLFVGCRLMRQAFPKVHQHFQNIGLCPNLFMSPWIMSMFTSGFLPETTLRIWDCFICEGEKIWFRVILSVIDKAAKQLLKSDPDEAIQLLTRTAAELSADDLLKAGFKFRLSRKKIALLDQEYEQTGRDQDYATWCRQSGYRINEFLLGSAR